MIEADPKILVAAETLFLEQGYHAVNLSDIATAANIPLPAVQTHFSDKDALLQALLKKHSPHEAIQAMLRQMQSDTAEEMVREAIQKMVAITEENQQFIQLAMIDVQLNDGAYLSELFIDLITESASFINRLSNMPGMRPVSSIMLGRAFASLMIGYIATQQFVPEAARFAMRIFPSRAWVDGITDIFLYGILEPE